MLNIIHKKANASRKVKIFQKKAVLSVKSLEKAAFAPCRMRAVRQENDRPNMPNRPDRQNRPKQRRKARRGVAATVPKARWGRRSRGMRASGRGEMGNWEN